MGMSMFGSRCSDDSHRDSYTPQVYIRGEVPVPGNPNPINFEIQKLERVKHFTIMLVEYPDCMNFEGKKILVFKTLALGDIKKISSLDPHFCDSTKHTSPVARFVPTDEGWWYATAFCNNA